MAQAETPCPINFFSDSRPRYFGGLLLIRETRGTQTRDIYPLYDGSGHVTGLTTIIDNVATLVAEYAYGPFGELIHARGPMALTNPWRYATKYYDSETGLYYYGARYLDPITGQWLNREPLGESESVNLYAYCHNDPVNRVDVLGLWEINSQKEADDQRVEWLLMQLTGDGKPPAAPLEMFKPYFPENGDFGLFKPYGLNDYKRADDLIRKQGSPAMREASLEEAKLASQPVMRAGQMPLVAQDALSLGTTSSPFMADINAAFVFPSGAGGFLLGGAVKGVQISRLLATGLSLERSALVTGISSELRTGALLAETGGANSSLVAGKLVQAELATNSTTWGTGGSGYTLNPFDLGRKGTIFSRAEQVGITTDRSLAAGQSGGLVGGVPTMKVQPFSTSTVATEEYLHARFAQRLVKRHGLDGAQRMMADPAFMLQQELRLKSKMIGAGERGFLGSDPMNLNVPFLYETRTGYQALAP